SATLPANSGLTAGTGTFNATLVTVGSQSITATDTVTASITGSQSGISVTGGGPSKLVFGVQPSTTAIGQPISPAVTVRVTDAGGNTIATDTSSVTLAIGTDPPGGTTLGGTKTVAAVAGVATFSTLTLSKAGTGFVLHATDGALTAANSAA